MQSPIKPQLLVRRIRETAALRPSGYVEDVLSRGTIIHIDGHEVLEITEEALEELRAKYAKFPPPPPLNAEVTASSDTTGGPGTELKALLKRVGIVASPGCSCNTRAKLMDANELKEPGWCENNLETICDWLQEEATKRKLPFLRMAGKILVRKAIRNARKKGQ
jgi:hypothetical protein